MASRRSATASSRFGGYRRAALPPADLQRDLTFQLLDCTQTKRSPCEGLSQLRLAEVPVLRLFGVTRDGHSTLVHVYDYEPYLWVEAPPNWDVSLEQPLRRAFNDQLSAAARVEECIVRIETHSRASLMYYTGGGPKPFLKIVTQMPGFVPKIRTLLTEGCRFSALWDGYRQFLTYESNVLFPLRFLVDCDIGGCNWVTVQGGQYQMCPYKGSTCQLEIQCRYPALTSHEPVGEYMAIAPLRVLSVDIECQGRKGFFPEADKDPVIQLACHCTVYGKEEPLMKALFCVGTCAAIAGADVFSFATESEMLIAWAEMLLIVDPDVVTGYNISNFDFPYLLNRADTLRIADRFNFWSRLLNDRTVQREKKFQSKQMGNRDYVEIAIEGRVTMDMLVVIQRDYKLRSYSLNSVSQHFLNEQKEDVHHSIISDLQNGTDETRRRLGVYCLKDAYLPIRLMEKLMAVVNNVEMSRVTGVPVGWLLERGQGIKVFSQMLRKARVKNLLFPTVERQFSPGELDAVGYEGATVIPPMKAFYNTPIATLDFASLYPSIMMAHNLCYSTLVPKSEVRKYDAAQLTTTPSGDTFVKAEVYQGILPEILVELLSARKNARALMKEAASPLEYSVLNGRQLALKVSANSVYGFTGAKVGKLPCLEISASVTAFGRTMIERTKELVEAKYPGVTVVYGDTDSVMVRCEIDGVAAPGLTDKERLERAMAFGVEAAGYVTSEFKKPIKLEFEKVYFPFLLMNKKRYAGLLWTKTSAYDKLDAKGIETVRRDNCPLVATLISGVLNRILVQRSVQGAIDFVKGTISDLLMNRLDISHLVITKAFTKSADEYENKQAHIALVERMRERDPASAPSIGDRIAYVIVKAAKGAKAFERSEDPIYVLDHNIPIDVQYYLEHHLSPPLLRVFEGVLPDPTVLIKGDHTRHVAQVMPSKDAGGLMKFVRVQLSCLGCRAAIKEGAVCTNCQVKAPDIYNAAVAKRNHYEALYSRVWTQCQQCQGSLHQDVLCSSRDCPVFYMRKKVQIDLKDQQTLIDRFGVVADW